MPLSLHLSYACNVGEDQKHDNPTTHGQTHSRNVAGDVESNGNSSWGFRSTRSGKAVAMVRSFMKKSWNCCNMWVERWNQKFGEWTAGMDLRQIFHSLKTGITLGMVCCIVLQPDVYDALGKNVIWAVLTVVVSFECTVGATILKGLNRGLATIFSALVGLLFVHLANQISDDKEPFVIGVAVLVVGTFSAYIRFIPIIKAKYDYGAVMLSLTFALVTVSGYRSPSTVDTVLDRMFTVLIGCIACLVMNVLIYPVWAGDDLHNLILNNFEDIAAAIEGCTKQYFFGDEKDLAAARRTSKICKGEPFNDPIYTGYRSVMTSKQMEDSLATFASWEPWHGRFGFSYPWDLCQNLGSVLRHIAYSVCSLHGCVLSDMQPPEAVRQIFSSSCMHVSEEVVKVLREVTEGLKFCRKSKRSVEDMLDGLQRAVLELHVSLERYNQGIHFQHHGATAAEDVNAAASSNRRGSSSGGGGDGGGGKRACFGAETGGGHVCSARCKEYTESLSVTTVACLLMEIASRIKPLLKVLRELEDKGRFTEPDQPKRKASLKRYKTEKLILQHVSSDVYPF